MIKKVFRQHFETEDEFQRFATWAFGLDYEDIETGPQLIQQWNNRHVWDYRLTIHRSMTEDKFKILDIWERKKP